MSRLLLWKTLAMCKKQRRKFFDFIHNTLLAHWSGICYSKIKELNCH
jgi:hypothetical protein